MSPEEFALVLGAGLGVSSATRVSLINKCSEAMGGLLKPWQIRRVGQANADVRVIDAKADQEIEGLVQRTVDRQLSEGMLDTRNIEAVLRKALPNVTDEARPENIEVDWLANFLDRCRLVSNEEMQKLFSQVLAGESNRPGSISLRTVSFLATIIQMKREIFRKYAP